VRSRARHRWLRLTIGMWAAAVLLAAPVSAAEPAYVAEMPTTAQVIAQIHGSDPVDTAARRYVAFFRLESMVNELIGDRLVANQATTTELALRRTYHDAYLLVQSDLLASLPEAERVAAPNTKFGRFRALLDTYCCKGGTTADPYVNAEFSNTLLTTFFSASFRTSYAKIHAVTVANQTAVLAPDPLPPQRQQAPGPDTSRIPIAFGLVMLNVILFGAGSVRYTRRRTDR
jgi:hypothetical protein